METSLLMTCTTRFLSLSLLLSSSVPLSPSLRYSGVLSAYGLALADVVEEVQEPCSLQYESRSFTELDRRVDLLSQRCQDTLRARGFNRSGVTSDTPNTNLLLIEAQSAQIIHRNLPSSLPLPPSLPFSPAN